MPNPRPSDSLWLATLTAYREAGWEGYEPGDVERMFWEVGFKQGVAAANRHSNEPHPNIEENENG